MKNKAIIYSVGYCIFGLLWIFFIKRLFVGYSLYYTQGERFFELLFIGMSSAIFYVALVNSNKRLIKSKRQYQRLFEENPNPMWIYDLENLQIMAVNNAALHSYGYNKIEFMHLTIKDLRPDEEMERLEQNLKLPEIDFSNSGIWQHKRKDGTSFFVNIYSHSTIFNERKARLVLALDINDKFLVEKRIKAQNEQLKEIARIQSHDIRRPVASILGLISLFDRKNLDNEFNAVIIEKLGIVGGELDKIIHAVVEKTHELEIFEDKEIPAKNHI